MTAPAQPSAPTPVEPQAAPPPAPGSDDGAAPRIAAPRIGVRQSPEGHTLTELLAASTAKYANKTALLIKPGFRTRVWTHRDLAEMGPKVARVFAEMGLAKGDRIVIWAVNRPEWGLAYFGALHAGIVLVPLDVRSQPDFAAKIVRRTRAKAVLASVQTAPLAEGLKLPVVLIEKIPDLARDAQPLPSVPVTPSDLVEVVFTSGTTGEPKGAMITHANLAANAVALGAVFPFRDDERLLSLLPLSHLFEQTCGFLTPLLNGCSIVYPVSRQPAVLMRTFRDFQVTMLLVVPAGLKLLNNAIERKVDATGKRALFERLHALARRLPRPLKRLLFGTVLRQFGGRFRTLAVGAAALETELAQRWMEMGFDVLQGYGATELSPVVSFTHPRRNRLGTVGEAIPGVEVRIAPDGEVLVRGPNVFAGYWEDPENTARAIDPDGSYHTGDMGELSPDGFLTLRGRKKDMLAMPDGTKVYPEDIEAVLGGDERIRESTVVGWQPPGSDLKVHAVFVLDDPMLAEAIVRDANAQLGQHQQIRSWSLWPDAELPRTHTLKVKKPIVLARLQADLDGADGSAAARPGMGGPMESAPSASAPARPGALTVTDLVCSVTGLPVASVQPGMTLSGDLNMDSLSRVELLGVIEEELGVYVDDGDLDPEATVEELTATVEAARDAKRETGIYGWPLNPLVRAIGIIGQTLFAIPFLWLTYRVRITGAEHLRGLRGPVLFTPNHCLHNDVGIILTRFPVGIRWRLSVAAAADDIFGHRLKGFISAAFGNAFPLAREGAIRRSLELLGARLDRGYSILIFPEGKLTVGGPTQPFKSGTGLLAVEGATPVVPMKLKINRLSRWDAPGMRPWRGDVELVYGEPIHFAWGTDHATATERLQAAVEAL